MGCFEINTYICTMLLSIKKHFITKSVTYLLLLNFINLTANFYQASVIDTNLLINQDPIDTLAEVFLEYFLDMDEETIPDTEVPHEKRQLGDIKLAFFPTKVNFEKQLTIEVLKLNCFYLDSLLNTEGEPTSPPPKFF